MKRSLVLFLAAILGMSAVACASSGGGVDDVYSIDLGRQIDTFLAEARQKIWSKHGIPLYREEVNYREIYWESEWMPRAPQPGEAALGVSEGRNRLVLRGRRSGDSDFEGGGGIYRSSMELQNEVRSATVPEWHAAPLPDAVRSEFRRVMSDMEMEVRSGVRR